MGVVDRVVRWPRGVIERMLRDRARLPRFVNRAIDHIAEHPDGLFGRLAARSLGRVRSEDIPPPTSRPEAARAVYIGPTNYAAQGWHWARSLDRSTADVGARNMAVEVPGGFDFPADTEVPIPVYSNSAEWQRAELEAVSRFTHVLIEAERPLFGRLLGRDVARELAELTRRGLSTAFMCHGTDIRLPSRHLETTPWSPFTDEAFYVAKLERDAARNRELLDTAARPTFVSTPDLINDVPYGIWCPVVVEPRRWAGGRVPGERSRPVVAHAPSKAAMKGSHLIEPVLRELDAHGVIEYRPVSGVPSAQMPALYREADIVLDQFRLGSYGVAACEAMAAGRVVIGHVTDDVRDRVLLATGEALPIVEATPATIADVLTTLVADRQHMIDAADAGRAFVDSVHDGQLSARVLLDEWILT